MFFSYDSVFWTLSFVLYSEGQLIRTVAGSQCVKRGSLAMAIQDFRKKLIQVDGSYEAFVDMAVRYVEMTGNYGMVPQIVRYIDENPYANCSDVLHYMVSELRILSCA